MRLSDEVLVTKESLQKALFGSRRYAEVILARLDDRPVGFAIFFHNFSTFLGKPGLYLEDLFVLPEFRSQWIGKALLIYLANLALERGCGRFEWAVLDWNESAIEFYKRLGAVPLEDLTCSGSRENR
jgi:GNAT superfamily N-acetyltransferase